jgi:putative PIN family toxin of toxin-antitoxin system
VRVTIDSSVLIAATAFPGVCTQLLDAVAERHELVISEFILDEVQRKLRVKAGFSEDEILKVMTRLRRVSSLVEPATVEKGRCRDETDLPILGTAIAAHALFLVTLDKDLLVLGQFQGIKVVRPGDFFRFEQTMR